MGYLLTVRSIFMKCYDFFRKMKHSHTRHVAFTKNFFPKSLRRVEEEMYHKLRNNIKRQEYNNFK